MRDIHQTARPEPARLVFFFASLRLCVLALNSARFRLRLLLADVFAEEAQVGRVGIRARAEHGAQPLSQREPVRRFERLQFSVRVQPHLRQVAEKIREPFRRRPGAFQKHVPHANSTGPDAVRVNSDEPA